MPVMWIEVVAGRAVPNVAECQTVVAVVLMIKSLQWVFDL